MSAALTHSIDPLTGDTLNLAAQHYGYQVFDAAWVHARHSKYQRMALLPSGRSATSGAGHLNQSSNIPTELQHPKQAYMRGLLDSRLRLHGAPRPSTAIRVPQRLPSGRVAPRWMDMTRELWAVASSGDPLALTAPDNAYMMGAIDGAFRFLEENAWENV